MDYDDAQLLDAVSKIRAAYGLPEAMLLDDAGQALPARGQLFGVLIEVFGSILSNPDVQKRLIDLLLGVLTRGSQE